MEGEFYDAREARSPAEREAALLACLRDLVAGAKSSSPYYRDSLGAIDPTTLTDLAALAALPVVRKSTLSERQAAEPPFGGLAAKPAGTMARVFLSPGPIAEPQVGWDTGWRLERALFAAGFRRGEVVHNCFSYHLTPAGAMFDQAARALGCAVFPGGVGQSEAQVEAMHHYRPSGYIGTPDFLKVLLEKAGEMGRDLESVSKALVTGGPLFPALRAFYEERGIAVRQCYATAELGLIAYESAVDAGMVVDEDVILEIVRPGTGDPVPEGEVGEVVVTTFEADYPLIRLATGDLSAFLPGESPCGRTNRRIKGWMGRADQTAKVRGMFVRPEQVARTIAGFPEVAKARLVISETGGLDEMRLLCEVEGGPSGLVERLAEALRAECRLRGTVELVAPGSLPNDGKVIEDTRSLG